MSDLESMSDDTWHTLLQDVLVRYVTLLTNPEGPAPSAPTLTRNEIIEHDTARKEASAAAVAAASAAADGGCDSCGNGGGDNDASGHGDEDEAAQPGERRSEPFVGRLFPSHNCHGGAWNNSILITNTRVRIE
jgi:hypothetical protein